MNTELIAADRAPSFSTTTLVFAGVGGVVAGVTAHRFFTERRRAAAERLKAADQAAAALEQFARELDAVSTPAEDSVPRLALAEKPKPAASVDRTLVELIERTNAEISKLIAITDGEALAEVVNFAKDRRKVLADPEVTTDQVVEILTNTLNALDAEEGE